MPSGVDIFGVLTGVVGLFGTFLSLWQLFNPRQLLRTLDKSLSQCERLLVSAREEDQLPSGVDCSISERLFLLRCSASELRASVFAARSLQHTGKLVVNGYAKRIRRLNTMVIRLQGELQMAIDYDMFYQRERLAAPIHSPAQLPADMGVAGPPPCHCKSSATVGPIFDFDTHHEPPAYVPLSSPPHPQPWNAFAPQKAPIPLLYRA